jgi:hypothetical protein
VRSVITGPLHPEGCLFCRQSDGGFQSIEHIFPEALGNKEFVLERGIVCDRCNNGPLGTADGALVGYQPIAFRRTFLQIKGKRGNLPESRWGNATISHAELGKLLITETAVRPTITPTGPNSFRMTLKSAGPIGAATYAKIGRSIWKSAIEFTYLDRGPEEAFNPRYDEVRRMIIGRTPAHGVLLIATTGDPDDTSVSMTCTPSAGVDGRDRLIVHARYYGIEMGTELLVRELTPIEGAENAANVIVF